MNVSIKTSCFQSKTPTESSCRQSISARNTSTWAFFSNAIFHHFPLEDFSQTNGNRLVGEGGVEKSLHQQPQKKKGGRKRQCPRTVRGLPQTLEPGPSSRFQLPRPFERLPLCLFRKVSVVRRLSRVFPSASSDVEENCLGPQLSSAVVRLVL